MLIVNLLWMPTQTTYEYNIANDLPGGAVDVNILRIEIENSAITVPLDDVYKDATTLYIVFEDVLPSADKTVLDDDIINPAGGLLAAHDNSQLLKTYEYNIANDLPDGAVNVETLKTEITNSAITIALDYISTNATTLYIVFKNPLPSADKTILDNDTTNPAGGLLAAHDNSDSDRPVAEVAIREETQKTGGRFEARTITVWADALSTTTKDEVMFVDTSAMSIHFIVQQENLGDEVNLHVAPDTTVGAITANVGIGDTVINVSSTVTTHAFAGPCMVKLTDGTNTETLGRIKLVDKYAGTLTVENAATQAFAAATPTYVQITAIVMRDYTLGPVGAVHVGDSKIGGSFVPQNSVVRVLYQNRSPKKRVGQITSDVTSGDTVIDVDSATCDALIYNDKIELFDGTNTSALGFVTLIDPDQLQITVSVAASQNFATATPTYVRKTAKQFISKVETLQ